MPKLPPEKELREQEPEAIRKYRENFPAIDNEGAPPRMPINITGLTTAKLGDLSSRYAAWREYTEELHSIAVAHATQAQEAYDLAYSKAWTLSMSKYRVVTDKKEWIHQHEPLVPLYSKKVEAFMYKDLLGRRMESYTNALTVISRELTRRGQLPVSM